jgi:hypothetical protein
MNSSDGNTIFCWYNGPISREHVQQFVSVVIGAVAPVKGKKFRCVLSLETMGGDPHQAYRMARFLNLFFGGRFECMVPTRCKSAGTLIALGANKLVAGFQTELGPIDMQVWQDGHRPSGLVASSALDYLERESKLWTMMNIEQLCEEGWSTRRATDIALRLTATIYSPIARRIDPIQLGQMDRAISIGTNYGERLSKAGGNLRQGALFSLVKGYPDHGFVIDFEECMNLFVSVELIDGEYSAMNGHAASSGGTCGAVVWPVESPPSAGTSTP